MTDDAWRTGRRRFLSLAVGTAVAAGAAPAPAAHARAAHARAGTSPTTGHGGSEMANPYARWENGPCPRPDPSYFPIGVWLQEPDLAPQYRQAGINLYVGLWEGPTAEQLATLAGHGMPVIADQNDVGLGFGTATRWLAGATRTSPTTHNLCRRVATARRSTRPSSWTDTASCGRPTEPGPFSSTWARGWRTTTGSVAVRTPRSTTTQVRQGRATSCASTSIRSPTTSRCGWSRRGWTGCGRGATTGRSSGTSSRRPTSPPTARSRPTSFAPRSGCRSCTGRAASSTSCTGSRPSSTPPGCCTIR